MFHSAVATHPWPCDCHPAVALELLFPFADLPRSALRCPPPGHRDHRHRHHRHPPTSPASAPLSFRLRVLHQSFGTLNNAMATKGTRFKMIQDISNSLIVSKHHKLAIRLLPGNQEFSVRVRCFGFLSMVSTTYLASVDSFVAYHKTSSWVFPCE